MGLNEKFFKSASGGVVAADNFTPITYTGNGGTQSTNSLSNQSGTINFKPDFSWIKVRSTTNDHTLQNSISGTSKFLRSNTTDAEGSNIEMVTSYNSNGFSLGPNALANQSSQTFVAWNWKAGGDAVLNEDGTLDSQVSANVDAGFSIVKWSPPNGAVTSNVGHGLDSAPELILYKGINYVDNWYVYSAPMGLNKYLYLNESNNVVSNANNGFTNVNSSTFTTNLANGNNLNILSYCFHSVDEYSKIGSYSGGQTLNTANQVDFGFAPAFVLIKNTTDSGSQWVVFDNKRTNGYALYANKSNVEGNYTSALLLSGQGLEFKSVNINVNRSGSTYIYMAIAE